VTALPLTDATDAEIRDALTAMIADAGYPCVGAKSVFTRGQVEVLVLDWLADGDAAVRLRNALADFAAAHPVVAAEGEPEMASFIAAFRGPMPATELEFEDLLWRQLALLHAVDDASWDEQVSPDPASPHFGFSVAGRAFFVIGMHPAASRIARRTPLPVLVFNLHSQFDQLRASGRYDRLRDTVRKRDVRLQGCPNPMLADHGARSEARQYSGRAVPDDWRPPAVYPLDVPFPEEPARNERPDLPFPEEPARNEPASRRADTLDPIRGDQ
jgi:FPC/CPF motif-containing protein YcgG